MGDERFTLNTLMYGSHKLIWNRILNNEKQDSNYTQTSTRTPRKTTTAITDKLMIQK